MHKFLKIKKHIMLHYALYIWDSMIRLIPLTIILLFSLSASAEVAKLTALSFARQCLFLDSVMIANRGKNNVKIALIQKWTQQAIEWDDEKLEQYLKIKKTWTQRDKGNISDEETLAELNAVLAKARPNKWPALEAITYQSISRYWDIMGNKAEAIKYAITAYNIYNQMSADDFAFNARYTRDIGVLYFGFKDYDREVPIRSKKMLKG